ncbi:Dolichyl-phosphate-mannose-protein mannosyltransferase [Rhodovulum sp. ES.010]|uniref:ArnT family glycosyltransferase n=1 Tax=Rhodovulum sp. ES.010 TaxID=1882821 RepID=UPI00092CBF63|nr:glycosyltransferase family 39 protein [Rhodovulum sp. ES.010]SIO48537.1 Dolichyl-phosphate-mannose-protein mannosyltransferase [Rhodovulum sp. ES.010]
MPTAAAPERRGWLIPAAAAVLAITAARVGLLWFNRMDLFVDEAQYWLWGQELAFGYYSKPPMIAWVIRAVTDLAGSDAPFWVRLPAPLFHGATALILGWIAARLWGARAAVWVALGYVTLPLVAVGSILVSTDTIMFPVLALALGFWLIVLERGGRGWAIAAGAALGLAFLSKYAAIYYVICAALAALILPAARPRASAALAALAAFALVISPNVVWNIANGLTTVQHTLDNADWVRDPATRAGLNLAGLAEFLASQFAVFGPVLFAALVAMLLRARQADPSQRLMLVFSLPILVIVSAQALLSGAYANWAAAAYLAGTLGVLPWLSSRWRVASFAVNGTVALALPVLGVFADTSLPGGRLPLERYVGLDEMTAEIVATARGSGHGIVVAEDRDLLADVFYSGRESGLTFHAVPPKGRAPHHYALKYPLPEDLAGEVLFATFGAAPACAPGAAPIATIAPQRGAYRGDRVSLYAVPAGCWAGTR